VQIEREQTDRHTDATECPIPTPAWVTKRTLYKWYFMTNKRNLQNAAKCSTLAYYYMYKIKIQQLQRSYPVLGPRRPIGLQWRRWRIFCWRLRHVTFPSVDHAPCTLPMHNLRRLPIVDCLKNVPLNFQVSLQNYLTYLLPQAKFIPTGIWH